MNLLVRAAIAVLCGVGTFLLRSYFVVLTQTLAIIGALVGLVVFFGSPRIAA
jgi:hypothetical protein